MLKIRLLLIVILEFFLVSSSLSNALPLDRATYLSQEESEIYPSEEAFFQDLVERFFSDLNKPNESIYKTIDN
ncbi:MAG: hypothetical protein AB1489_42995, partial [Acidobacteriota bacterium]